MYKSVESELAELRDQLGQSPLADIFSGIHYLLYQVAPGHGEPLAQEYILKTNYKLNGIFLHKTNRSVYYVMTLTDNPIRIVIEEKKENAFKYPRLFGLAYEVTDLALTRTVLKQFDISLLEMASGIVTEPISGFDDTFAYVENNGMDWFQSEEFERQEINPEKYKIDLEPAPYLTKIGGIDHIAYRIRFDGIKTAAKNLMQLTGYRFSDCYTIGTENAETMVFRWGDSKPAIVVSFGLESSSVVWQYVEKYGPRVHHTAFYTDDVLNVVDFQMKQKIPFTTEKMIGSKDRGILQIFTRPSSYNHEITEYIERFHGFTGFFDKGNVGDLMRSTKRFNE